MHAQSRRQAGFSLAEMLAVLALVGIVIAIGIPLVNEQVRIADIRSAADQMAVHLRAARMLAVTQHRNNVDVHVSVDPTNTYDYCAVDPLSFGGTCPSDKMRVITMPGTAKLISGSTATITFKSDGSAAAASTVTIQSLVSASTEQWTLTVNTLGMVSVAHARL